MFLNQYNKLLSNILIQKHALAKLKVELESRKKKVL